MELVSVGIPIYNGGKLLSGLLNSLVNQEYENLEFIICDNGSTDNSETIYREFASNDKRFKIFRSNETVSVVRNFNRAFELTTGNYMLWAAHDDRFHPSYIKRCVDELTKHPDAALAYTWTQFIDNDDNPIAEFKDPFDLTSESPVERYLNIIGKLGYCNAFYGVHRVSVINKTSLFYNYCLGGDAIFLLEILFHGKWIQIPEVLFYRNMHTKFRSVTGRNEDPRKWIENIASPPGSGITFPNLEYVLRHFKLIKTAPIPAVEKPKLIKATYNALINGPYFEHVKPEIDRAISLVCQNDFYQEWNEGRFQPDNTNEWNQYARPFYLMELLKNFGNHLAK